MTASERIHATCVALAEGAVLLRGPSGSGKSDLALRLIDDGASLVADDQTLIERSGDGLMAFAPPTICGQMEVRGLGLVSVQSLEKAPLALVVDLVDMTPERLPDSETVDILGVALPLLRLRAFEASAPAKLRLALRELGTAKESDR